MVRSRRQGKGRAVLARKHARGRKNSVRHGGRPFFCRCAKVATARIPHQSPVPLPCHHDLRCCGAEVDKRPHCAGSGLAPSSNGGYPSRCNGMKTGTNGSAASYAMKHREPGKLPFSSTQGRRPRSKYLSANGQLLFTALLQRPVQRSIRTASQFRREHACSPHA